MSPNNSVRVSTERLPVGGKLGHPINDEEDRLLLAAGAVVTARIKERLLEHGVDTVLLHPDDADKLFGRFPTADPFVPPKPETPPSRPAPRTTFSAVEVKGRLAVLADSVSLAVRNAEQPVAQRMARPGAVPFRIEDRQRLNERFAATSRLLQQLLGTAIGGRVLDEHILTTSTDGYLAELVADADHAFTSAVEAAPDPQLAERGVRLSLLGMAIAIEMQWDEPHIRKVGLSGLLHDWGMARVPTRLRDPQHPLDDEDWKLLAEHPLHTLEMIAPLKNISLAVRLAVTQVHENPDGSGYPRKLRQKEIHPYAAVLHGADAFLALTSAFRGRRPVLAYDAMVYLLHQVKTGRIDESVMRGLLRAASLFPLGSNVRLSDGSEARVIRRNTEQYMKPIVQRLDGDRSLRLDAPHPSIVDLAGSKVHIVAPLPRPTRDETRLERTATGRHLWDGADP